MRWSDDESKKEWTKKVRADARPPSCDREGPSKQASKQCHPNYAKERKEPNRECPGCPADGDWD